MHTLSILAKPLLSRQHISMPAKNLHREYKEGIYSHIYNKGAEKRIIFNDDGDYETFQGFLKDYLSAPQDPESIKKSFTVHGRTFRGTPHQPKNYFNKVELIAYSLMPNHFHLLLHQKAGGSLESFIRSLCTRYSMYFNKKYQHTGALFEGPYKSVQIKDDARLVHSTHFFHHSPGHSSYPEYLGLKKTSWVKPKTVLDFFDNGTASYKNFVEKYTLSQKEKELIKDIIFESETAHLERREDTSDQQSLPGNDGVIRQVHFKPQPHRRVNEFIAISTITFALFLALGLRNVWIAESKSIKPLPNTASEVLSTTTASADVKPETLPEIEATPEAQPETRVRIKTEDESSIVNIRQKPTAKSDKIGQAKDGESFEFISKDSDWFEVKVASQSGFISAEYIEEGK